jgi:hypothetical protein
MKKIEIDGDEDDAIAIMRLAIRKGVPSSTIDHESSWLGGEYIKVNDKYEGVVEDAIKEYEALKEKESQKI